MAAAQPASTIPIPQSFIFIFDLLESGLRTSRPPRREWRRSRWNIDVGIEGGTRIRRRVSDAREAPACGLWTATHRFAYHRVPMGLMRSAFLAGSQSRWLRERAVKYRFVKRAVARFMPGEDLDAALAAAGALRAQGIGSVLTCLGENLERPEEAEQVTRHYLDVM